MATSGTYTFSPSVGELVLSAFGRIGVRRTQITQQHLADAANEANFLQVEFSNRQPNLFSSELYSTALTVSVATYALLARFIAPMAVYMTVTRGGYTSDRILMPLSTYHYAAIPNKEIEGAPTSYWFNRQATPQITLWPVPDSSTAYELKIQVLSQMEDTSLQSGVSLDMPYRWMDAFVAGLAARLAAIYAPQIEDKRMIQAKDAWLAAAGEDVEHDTALSIIPMLSAYRY